MLASTVRKADVSRLLADEWIGGLDTRPFRPTANQLASVWGGELTRGETQEQRVRVAAGRYAALFTDHVVEDVTIEGGPGAYMRIWQCARQAFIQSMTSEHGGPAAPGDVLAWENEGGQASSSTRPEGRLASDDERRVR